MDGADDTGKATGVWSTPAVNREATTQMIDRFPTMRLTIKIDPRGTFDHARKICCAACIVRKGVIDKPMTRVRYGIRVCGRDSCEEAGEAESKKGSSEMIDLPDRRELSRLKQLIASDRREIKRLKRENEKLRNALSAVRLPSLG